MRVLMLGPDRPFVDDWAAAARLVADVVRVRTVTRLSGQPLPHLPGVGRAAGGEAYEICAPAYPPYRFAPAVSTSLLARRYERLLAQVETDEGAVDLIHAHFYPTARGLAELRARRGMRYVITEHSSALTLQSPDQRVSKRGLRIARRAYGHASRVLPVSESLRRAAESLGLEARYTVIPNPVDTTLFRRPAMDPAGPPHIVATARLAPVKRLDVLLRALASVRAEGRCFRATVIGDGPQRAELTALCRALDLQGSVAFIGERSRSEVAASLQTASLLALSSAVENLPVAVIEALCSGVPVVAPSVGGIPELVGPQDGVLVQPSAGPAEYASAIGSALSQGWEPDSISRRAAGRFSLEAVAALIDVVYRDRDC
jgi:glycosyltransferase involved in cell wall biosynthesis